MRQEERKKEMNFVTLIAITNALRDDYHINEIQVFMSVTIASENIKYKLRI